MIYTFSGIEMDVFNPGIEDIRIEDIANGLAMECRYAGQCKEFYSVAEHSVLLSLQGQTLEEQKILLLHDATEAYLSDVPRGLKMTTMYDEYREVEENLYEVIMIYFDLPRVFPQHLKDLDNRITLNEFDVLFDKLPQLWIDKNKVLKPLDNTTIRFWEPKIARRKFLARFEELFLGK